MKSMITSSEVRRGVKHDTFVDGVIRSASSQMLPSGTTVETIVMRYPDTSFAWHVRTTMQRPAGFGKNVTNEYYSRGKLGKGKRKLSRPKFESTVMRSSAVEGDWNV